MLLLLWSLFFLNYFLRFFFGCRSFLKSLLNLLQYCFSSMSWHFGHKACGISTFQLGTEPAPRVLEGEFLTTGQPGKSLTFLIFFFKVIIYFLAVLGLCCCVQALSSCSVWASHCCGFSCCGAQALGHSWASLWQHSGSTVVARRLSCPTAYEILPGHGSHQCPLH